MAAPWPVHRYYRHRPCGRCPESAQLVRHWGGAKGQGMGGKQGSFWESSWIGSPPSRQEASLATQNHASSMDGVHQPVAGFSP